MITVKRLAENLRHHLLARLHGLPFGATGLPGERFSTSTAPDSELQAVVAELAATRGALRSAPLRGRTASLRRMLDDAFADRVLAASFLAPSSVAWLRDQGLRAPDAVVALSPLTDRTLASPRLRANVRSDVMLGPLLRLPQWVLLWIGWLQTRINPRNPMISPLRGDQAGPPPILVQANEAAMLFDDSRRHANRARAAGSTVRLPSWPHAVQAWQIFNPELTPARAALAEIGRFLAEAAPPIHAPLRRGRLAQETRT